MVSKYLQPDPGKVPDFSRFLRCDLETDQLYWLVDRSTAVRSGNLAGTVDELGYVRVKVGFKKYLAHHVVWALAYGYLPKLLDHRDGNPSNNRLDNLRTATQQENANNSRLKPNAGVDSVAKGVFRARIRVGDKLHNLGAYTSFSEAQTAYLHAKASCPGSLIHVSELPPLTTALPKRLASTGHSNIYFNRYNYQVKIANRAYGTYPSLEQALAVRDKVLKQENTNEL